MSKKTKQPEKQYIAINNNSEDIIAIGNKKDVIELIQEYCYGEGWDQDDIEDFVVVYELGERIELNIETDIKVSF